MSRKNLLVICIILLGVLTISLGVAFPIPMAHAQVNPRFSTCGLITQPQL